MRRRAMMFDTSAYHYPSPLSGIFPQFTQGQVPPFAQTFVGGQGTWPTSGIGNLGLPIGGIPPQTALQNLCGQLGALSQAPALGAVPTPSYGLPYGLPALLGGIPSFAA